MKTLYYILKYFHSQKNSYHTWITDNNDKTLTIQNAYRWVEKKIFFKYIIKCLENSIQCLWRILAFTVNKVFKLQQKNTNKIDSYYHDEFPIFLFVFLEYFK